jgi:SAM-dependent methyltransferase
MMNDPATPGPPDWERRYREGDTPWHTRRPSLELIDVLQRYEIPPGRVLELGCGEGVNSVYLDRRGFEVTAIDVSPTAIQRARGFAEREGASVDFRVADVTDLGDVPAPFTLVFDRGLYHVVRRDNLPGLLNTLQSVTVPGSYYLTLAGNANEQTPEGQDGPPRVTDEEICREFAPLMQLIQLREFRFNAGSDQPDAHRPLGWSALFRRQ